MPAKPQKILNAVEAARWLYNSPRPTQEQLNKVVEKIEAGHLPRSSRGGHTTTAEGLAEYIARRESTRGSIYRGDDEFDRMALSRGEGSDDPFTETYQGVVKDLVLAALLRQKVKNRTPTFQRAVLATQAFLFVAALSVLIGLSALTFRFGGHTAEQRVAKDWLLKKYPGSQIRELKMLKVPPSSVKARFVHEVKERAVEEELILIVRRNEVVSTYSAAH